MPHGSKTREALQAYASTICLFRAYLKYGTTIARVAWPNRHFVPAHLLRVVEDYVGEAIYLWDATFKDPTDSHFDPEWTC